MNQSAYSNPFQISAQQDSAQGPQMGHQAEMRAGNFVHTPAGLLSARQTLAERQHLSVSGWNIEDAENHPNSNSVAQDRDGQDVTAGAEDLYAEFM